VDAIAGAALTHTSLPNTDLVWESDTQLKVHVSSDGLWNGVAFWFEVGLSLSCVSFFCWVTGELSTLCQMVNVLSPPELRVVSVPLHCAVESPG